MKHILHSLNNDPEGFFGEFGGSFVPDKLKIPLAHLASSYHSLAQSDSFVRELKGLYKTYANRPSLLYHAVRLSNKVGGAQIYLKREDLNHTGAHKINNCLGQALVASHMGKTKLIAETGAGQHGTATAAVAAYFGMNCDIYMGVRDMRTQESNVFRMKALGARVIPVSRGQGTLKDAVDAALEAYMSDISAYYLLGSAVGPHPYPLMVRDFQKIIGEELLQQLSVQTGSALPESIIACVGGGSNAIGAFHAFVPHAGVKLIAVEAGGKGVRTGRHGMSLAKGTTAVVHGFKTKVLCDGNGDVAESYSAASGLDYPGVGPELAHLYSIGRLSAVAVTDRQAVSALFTLARTEGIIPALESAHAVAYGIRHARKLSSKQIVVINLSGRGDKDVQSLMGAKK